MKRIKEIIDEIAETISKEYHIIGSSMEKTIKKMNIKIIKTDRIDDVLNGTIRRNENQMFEIFLYPDEISEEKVNFILARELCHILLHIGTNIKEDDLSVKKTFAFSIEEKAEDELDIIERQMKFNIDYYKKQIEKLQKLQENFLNVSIIK